MITNRLLTQDDTSALKEILEEFIVSQKRLKNPLRPISSAEKIVTFILDNFIPEHSNNVMVSGSFIENKLSTICVGSKFYPYFKVAVQNGTPSWIMVLMYSSEVVIKNPSQKIFDAGTCLVRNMEEQGYYSFYQSFKFPNLTSNEECQEYIDKYFLKMSVMDRYINILEYVLHENSTLDDVPIGLYRGILGIPAENRNRKLCITSHHLKNRYRKYNL